MTTITFDPSQFSIIFLLVLTGYCLLMGHLLNNKNGGWFLLFGGIFTLSLMSAVLAMFGLLWLIISPGFFVFGIYFMYQGILQMLYFKDTENKKQKRK